MREIAKLCPRINDNKINSSAVQNVGVQIC